MLIGILSASVLLAQSFSIDIPSPGITPPVPGDAILGSGPVVVATIPPTIALPAPITVPGAGAGIEVDALSYPHPSIVPTGIIFSVAPGSDESADIYFSTAGSGGNALIRDGNGSTATSLGLPEPAFANLDGLDTTSPEPTAGTLTIFYSVDPATAAGPYTPASPADIFSIEQRSTCYGDRTYVTGVNTLAKEIAGNVVRTPGDCRITVSATLQSASLTSTQSEPVNWLGRLSESGASLGKRAS